MRKDREGGKWTFGLLWIIANIFGWGTRIIVSMAAGWIVWEAYDNFGRRGLGIRFLQGESNRMVIALVISCLCWGTIIGVLQQFILRRRFELEGKRWVLATIIGLTVYTTAQTFVPALAASLSFRSYQILAGISTFVSPFAFGIAQWFLLRRYFPRSGWWIAATAIASWLSHFARSTFTTGQLRSSVLIVSYFVEGLLYGVATLIALTIISRQSTVAEDKEERRHKTQNKGVGFNWMLPLFGAIGFGGGFACMSAINITNLNIAQNAFAHAFSDPGIGLAGVLLRGIIVGAIGGAALGLAFKDKMHVLYFSLTGAIGFALAFTGVISLDPGAVPYLGRAIIRAMGGPEHLSLFETSLAHGLGAGAIVGATGGLVLGLASTKGRFVSSLLLGLTGAIWFANAFAIDSANTTGAPCYSWDGWGGAVGGAIFGLTLALYYKIHDKMRLSLVADDVSKADDISKFIGEWENEAGNLVVIQQKTDQSCSVSFFKGPNSEPVLRPYCGDSPSLEMDSYLTEHGTTLEVELWEKGKGYNLHLTYERAYALDKERRDSFVANLSRYLEDAFLDQYDHLFEPLEHYTRKNAEPVSVPNNG